MPTRLLACSLFLLSPAAAIAQGDSLCESLSELFDADQPYKQYAFLDDDQLESLKVSLGLFTCNQYPRVSLSCRADIERTKDYSVAQSWTDALQEKSDALAARLEACPSFEDWRPQDTQNFGSATYPMMTRRWLHHGRDLQITLTHGFVRHGKKGAASYESTSGIRFEAIEP
jgi:hypothetical protein